MTEDRNLNKREKIRLKNEPNFRYVKNNNKWLTTLINRSPERKEKREWDWKSIWRNKGWKLSMFDKTHKLTS
jgi:hypothetical protein